MHLSTSRLSTVALILLTACGPSPISEREINSPTLGSHLPPGFLLGAATAAFQVEGGLDNDDWSSWAKTSFQDGTPHVANGDQVGNAVDAWNRFDTDLGLLIELGADTYRFSVDWGRLEPSRGAWDAAAAARYRDWALKLRAAGIHPMVTLYHFALPQWVADQGGWESDQTIADLESFSGRVASLLGDQVDLWCTINEPNGVAIQGFIIGVWPPGKHDQQLSAEALARMLEAHARMAAQLRALDAVDADGDGRATMIGLTQALRVLQPATPSILDSTIASFSDDFTNDLTIRALATGRFTFSVPGLVAIDREIPGLVGSSDFFGVQYYQRNHIRADLSDPSLSQQYAPAGRPTSDLGWDIYPEGLYQLLMRVRALGLPIYVTENGIADADGGLRPRYLRAHIAAIERALADGADVRGYVHWSLMDNFEWADGWGPKFGLYRVDLSTYDRSPTEAVEDFRTIARNAGKSVP